ncbi:MAG: hypothetical protein K2J49_05670 [Muribaculaceae bacterium]|nr:hypothetical protein [Muribaculaceae bacterium]
MGEENPVANDRGRPAMQIYCGITIFSLFEEDSSPKKRRVLYDLDVAANGRGEEAN